MKRGRCFGLEGRAEAFLDLNGDTLDSIDAGRQLSWCASCRQLGGKATRCDVALSTMSCRVASMDDIRAAADRGNYAGFLKHMPLREQMRDGTITGDSVTFGARGKDGSGKYMRIYDKALESGGVVDAIRYECVFSKRAR
jgi:DNA relaxase NicK